MESEKTIRIRKIISITLVAVFCALVFIPNLNINYKDTKSEKENRSLASFPKKNSPYFTREFEQWYNDRFFGRRLYISIMEFFRLKPNQKVIVGKDDWLFLNGDEKFVEDYINGKKFSDVELKNISSYICSLSDWCKSNGKQFLFVIAPDKMRVYGEFYADYVGKINPDSQSKTMQLIDYFNKHTDVRPVYLIDDLLDRKKSSSELLYYKNDTHWNDYGAYEGYKRINRELGTHSSYVIKVDSWTRGKNKKGDLNNLYPEGTSEDSNSDYLFANYDYTFTSEHNNPKEPLAYDSKCASGEKSLVVFRDSFFNAMHPYFSQQFASVKDYWKKEVAPEDLEYIKNNGDLVIYESVERFLFLLAHIKFPDGTEMEAE